VPNREQNTGYFIKPGMETMISCIENDFDNY